MSCPSSKNFNSFRTLNDRFGKLLDKFSRQRRQRTILEKRKGKSPNENLFTGSINSAIKRPERIPVFKDEAGVSAITAAVKAFILAEFFQNSYSEHDQNNDTLKMVNSFCGMGSSAWYNKDEIYKELCSMPLSYSVTPDEGPPFLSKRLPSRALNLLSIALMLGKARQSTLPIGNMLYLHQYKKKYHALQTPTITR